MGISQERRFELMKEAIKESTASVPEFEGDPNVGAILADQDGETVGHASRQKHKHAEYQLLEGLEGRDLSETTLFVTLEPCCERGPPKTPCARRIIDRGIREVWIGMFDPTMTPRGIWLLEQAGVQVDYFPHDLRREIYAINQTFLDRHRSRYLSEGSLYVRKQIPDLIREYLNRNGVSVDSLPAEWDVTTGDLLEFCRQAALEAHKLDGLEQLLFEARGWAFDKKYATYSYEDDSRSLGDSWKEEIRSVLRDLRLHSFGEKQVVNVGIGNGLEARGLFDEIPRLVAVDIAPQSLKLARPRIGTGQVLRADAENLSAMQSGSQDLYVSLRTYQSTYLDISRAIREAYRVLRYGGCVVISIANGFLRENSRSLVPGLVIPRTNVVNRDRPFEVADSIRKKLTQLRFEEIGLRTGVAEIYLFGRKAR